MRLRMRHVEQERLLPVPLDEAHRVLCDLRRQAALIHQRAENLVALQQRQRWIIIRRPQMLRPHVAGIRQSEILIEPLPQRQQRHRAPQVPLSKNRRRITFLPQHLRQRRLRRIQPLLRQRPQRPVDAHAAVHTARHQRRPARRAHRAAHIEPAELPPLRRHPVQVRRLIFHHPKRPDVRVAQIIAQDDHHIRQRLRGAGKQRDHQQQKEKAGSHGKEAVRPLLQ